MQADHPALCVSVTQMRLSKEHEVPALHEMIFNRHFRAPALRIAMAYRRFRARRARRAAGTDRAYHRKRAVLVRYLRWLEAQLAGQGDNGWQLEMPPETTFQLYEATLRIMSRSRIYFAHPLVEEDINGDVSIKIQKRRLP